MEEKKTYRGFNLLDLFSTSNRWDEHFPMSHGDFVEDDFKWMHEWGFNFARIPMSYLYFISDGTRKNILESRLKQLDRLVEYGDKYDIHISLNYHRAPGYCVTAYPFDVAETGNLWKSPDDFEVFCTHWETFAERFKGVSGDKLSFDLLNEPPSIYNDPRQPKVLGDSPIDTLFNTTQENYLKIHRTAAERIHAVDPDRMVIIEGSSFTHWPAWELKDMPNTMQALHVYMPLYLTHYRCPWGFPEGIGPIPEWPYKGEILGEKVEWNKEFLRQTYTPWLEFAEQGYSFHIGECGCCGGTPHDVALAWFEDMLSLFKEYSIGYALWNFRGPFGILDSGYEDAEYEDWYGHKLDRKLLELLQKY